MDLLLSLMASPIGEIRIVSDAHGQLRALDFEGYDDRMMRLLALHYGEVALAPGPAPAGVAAALDAYFAGDVAAIDPIPALTAGTDFQRDVWATLRTIGPGETVSYGELARLVGRPKASRAVGAANGANPVALIVPCHRVIGASGALTGYGGGMARKQWLIDHERRHTGQRLI